MFTTAVLLGGNLGDVQANFRQARERMEAAGNPIVKASSLYRSPAWGFEAEEEFLNQALLVQTELQPEAFLGFLLGLEQSLGRQRKANEGYASRLIDIDILLWEDRVWQSSVLQIPHPRMQLRRFALAPLAEIAPDMWHPVLGMTVGRLLDGCPDTSDVIKLS
jgi:2-amino-4-hydroxy-6-hydroxymethyldihydropteridine diphosphokinase